MSMDAIMTCMKVDALVKDGERAKRNVSTVRPAMAVARFVRVPAKAMGTSDKKEGRRRGDELSGDGDGRRQTGEGAVAKEASGYDETKGEMSEGDGSIAQVRLARRRVRKTAKRVKARQARERRRYAEKTTEAG
ncbi:hypothetical protein GN244_ATG06234 [Phytophthora infestans]|uniref:Uncharacterized protein n=1 Tax=Phytophthora infestans TaxID=4787 RepID=A0A833WH58_PHYIN|nr:hypothetical protein GN244_ATG06234 [Phytophthora infestans]